MISKSKTEYNDYDFGAREHGVNRERHVMKLSWDEECEVEGFKYLQSVSKVFLFILFFIEFFPNIWDCPLYS